MADTKLYNILGVQRNASDSEIKKVFYINLFVILWTALFANITMLG